MVTNYCVYNIHPHQWMEGPQRGCNDQQHNTQTDALAVRQKIREQAFKHALTVVARRHGSTLLSAHTHSADVNVICLDHSWGWRAANARLGIDNCC